MLLSRMILSLWGLSLCYPSLSQTLNENFIKTQLVGRTCYFVCAVSSVCVFYACLFAFCLRIKGMQITHR